VFRNQPLSDFPADLLIFHFFVPWIISFAQPKKAFKKLVSAWFHWISKKLKITGFVFGGRHPDEEELDGNYEQGLDLNSTEESSSSSSFAKSSTKKSHFLQVPNHDHVEVIPGQKMLTPIGEHDPLVGRPNETPEEVTANWTKVYVPNSFRYRVRIFILFFPFLYNFLKKNQDYKCMKKFPRRFCI